MSLSLEMQEGYLLHGNETLERVIGLNRSEFDALPPDVRAAPIRHQVTSGRRLVPSLRSHTGEPRVEPCLGCVVVHPEGTLLFDTGMEGDFLVDQRCRPRRTGLAQALSSVGASVDDLDLVANCHLHFDDCGGNAFFASKPIDDGRHHDHDGDDVPDSAIFTWAGELHRQRDSPRDTR